jgi:hypothetical protein
VEIDFSLLADGISQRPDGKLDIFGAGVDQVNVVALPAMHPSITLVLRILLDAAEAEESHTLTFDVIDPDGKPRMPSLPATFEPPPQEVLDQVPAGQPFGMGLNIVLQGIVFEQTGPHAVVVSWDGNECERVRLNVNRALPASG